MPDHTPGQIERHISLRLKSLRAQNGLTLQELANKSGVSRSMISLIERGASSPTATILDKLAASLGVTLASLFAEEKRPDAAALSRRSSQLTWRDPGSGYIRRNLSPSAFASPIELVEVTMPPRTRISYDSPPRRSETHQQIWVLAGTIEIMINRTKHVLLKGDCLAMILDSPITFRNTGSKVSRHLVGLVAMRKV
jgi:transcriptional regulator with XRE-family HTH domain